MNAAEVIEYARRWADLHRANAHQREGVKRVDDLLALAEEQAATIARVRALAEQWNRETRNRPASEGPVDAWLHECAHDLRAALDGDQP